MNRVFLLVSFVCSALISIFSTASLAQQQPTLIRGKIIKISDGDTVHFLPDSAKGDILQRLKLRFNNIDTAETHILGKSQGYWGEQGALQLARLLPIGVKATIKAYGLDKYGRTISQVFVGQVNINLEMVKSGWASMYVICAENCSRATLIEGRLTEFRNACISATKMGLGLFNPKYPLPEWPFVFRSKVQKTPLHRFVGDMSKKKYLAPNDYNKVHVCNRLFFATEADAQRLGFTKGF